MGLAPYGEPKFKDLILSELMNLKEDGSFALNMDYFDYGAGLRMTSAKFHKLFGGEPRKPEIQTDAARHGFGPVRSGRDGRGDAARGAAGPKKKR